MSNLCIIPARGGSKRIPRKNIKLFLGKPIIAYSIKAAINSGLFDEIIVSTDDKEIAEIALKHGAKVPFLRSIENSDDFATIQDVLHEVISKYANLNLFFDNICVLYPTAPLVQVRTIKEGFEKLKTNSAVLPITEFSYPVWRSFKMKNNRISFQWPEHKNSRSQDLEQLYHDAGQWFWMKNEITLKTVFPNEIGFVLLSNMEVQDIDTESDWEIAEQKFIIINKIK